MSRRVGVPPLPKSYYLKCHRPNYVIIGGLIYILPMCNFREAPCPPRPRGSTAIYPNSAGFKARRGAGEGRKQQLKLGLGSWLLQGRGVLAGSPNLMPILA